MAHQVRWAPRLNKALLRRLYESEAAGRMDEELLDEVGITLLLRAQDILYLAQTFTGLIRCTDCHARGTRTMIPWDHKGPGSVIRCPVCAWQATWGEYWQSFHQKQLSVGGARGAFEAYVEGWPKARDGRTKMLLIDQLIHEFHYYSNPKRGIVDLPSRAVGVNLIEGRLTDVVAFLDELSRGTTDPELVEDHKTWQKKIEQGRAS